MRREAQLSGCSALLVISQTSLSHTRSLLALGGVPALVFVLESFEWVSSSSCWHGSLSYSANTKCRIEISIKMLWTHATTPLNVSLGISCISHTHTNAQVFLNFAATTWSWASEWGCASRWWCEMLRRSKPSPASSRAPPFPYYSLESPSARFIPMRGFFSGNKKFRFRFNFPLICICVPFINWSERVLNG